MFGKAEPCDCVLSEATDTRRTRLERIGNLAALRRFTFETLTAPSPEGFPPAFAASVEAARGFAHEPTGWLVLTGPSGSGKTHLAAAIANQRVDAGQPALFVSVPDLLDHLRASFTPEDDEPGFDRLFEQVRTSPLLILDDVDSLSTTPWSKEKLFQLLNARYNERLPTVFTTSTDPRRLDDRLAMRLTDPALATVCELHGVGRGGYEQVGGMSRERLAEMTFANFDLRVPGLQPDERMSLDSAFRAAQLFAEQPEGWLLLQGTNGCGKTHLATAVANKVLFAGGEVFFAVVPDLLDHLRRSYAPGRDLPYDDLFDRAREASLLVLDDFGAQAASPWAQEKLFQVVNYRTVAGLPTVVTTDQTPADLQAAHPRIWARIADPRTATPVVILAPHYRLGRPQGQRYSQRGPRRP